jgi:shikimate kinase
MESKENLVFLGMMGSGKSSIGSLIAKKLNIKFIDVDKEIEKELGLSISKIFETKGENYFRKFEQKITLKILKFNSTVVSLGGGAFMNKVIRNEILKNHISFWLNWDNETLLNRIKNSKKRPLAFNSTENELIDLIKNDLTFILKHYMKLNVIICRKVKLLKKF